MFKKIIAIFVLCLTFSSCERSSPDFDITADIVYQLNIDEIPIPWVLTNELIHTYVSSGGKVLANETKINDFSNLYLHFKPFYFHPDKTTLSYSNYKIESETTTWEAIKNNEIIIYSDNLPPNPFEEIVYKITKLTDTELEMVSRIETFSGNVKTSLRTVLYFERNPNIVTQPQP